jgi:hypothetical protein
MLLLHSSNLGWEANISHSLKTLGEVLSLGSVVCLGEYRSALHSLGTEVPRGFNLDRSRVKGNLGDEPEPVTRRNRDQHR